MDFIYKLYENEFFNTGLFIVIGILSFLFILILILGKLDEKKRKEESPKKDEIDTFKEVKEEPTKLEVENKEEVKEEPTKLEVENKEEVKEEIVKENTSEPINEVLFENINEENHEDNLIFDNPLYEENSETEEFLETPTEVIFEKPFTDLEELEQSLEKGFNELSNDIEEARNMVESINEPTNTDDVLSNITTPVFTPMNEEVENTYEEPKKENVYINEIAEVAHEEKPVISPIMPSIELPKLDKEDKEEAVKDFHEEPVIKEEVEELMPEEPTPGLRFFTEFEEESYDINNK